MKQVGDGEGPPTLAETSARAYLPCVSLYDLYALEEALDLREKQPGIEITALTIGPEDCDQVVRYAMARGADHAVRIWHDSINPDDPFAIGMIVALFARFLGCSLIFCGIMSEDLRSAIMPSFAAERLGWNWLNMVIDIEPAENGSGVRVIQKREKGKRVETFCGFPAVLACCHKSDGFDYVSLHRRLRMQNKPVRLYGIDDLEMETLDLTDPPMKILKSRNPKPRTKRTPIALEALSGEDLMWGMITGSGGTKDDDQISRGSPNELAGKILDLLIEEGAVDKSQLAFDNTGGREDL
ncbi:electron transfer flavoprotein subunit beta/FixA family protein [Desulfosarcina widdelii]|nr:hypothetical protein [Desulfosarcina widdelii]